MNKVDTYISELEPKQVGIVSRLRQLIVEDFPQLKEEFKWNQPVYTVNGKDVVYILATQHGVNLGFTKGAQLDDPQGLLEGSGKDMRHIKVQSVDSLDLDYVKRLISQSLNHF